MIEHINSHKLIGDMKIKRIIDRHTFRPENIRDCMCIMIDIIMN